MLSLIQFEIVDRHHWLTLQQFTDIVAISQMTPGPIGINSATYWLFGDRECFGGLLLRRLLFVCLHFLWYCLSLTSL